MVTCLTAAISALNTTVLLSDNSDWLFNDVTKPIALIAFFFLFCMLVCRILKLIREEVL